MHRKKKKYIKKLWTLLISIKVVQFISGDFSAHLTNTTFMVSLQGCYLVGGIPEKMSHFSWKLSKITLICSPASLPSPSKGTSATPPLFAPKVTCIIWLTTSYFPTRIGGSLVTMWPVHCGFIPGISPQQVLSAPPLHSLCICLIECKTPVVNAVSL